MKFFTVIVTLFLLFGKGSLQPNQVDIRIQNYVRIKFDGFRAWFVDHGHTEREHDFPGSRVINVSSTFYQLSSLLSEAKLHIYWPDLRTKSITSFSSRGSIMVEMDPSSDPNIIGTHSTTGSEMGNPLDATGSFNHTYVSFSVHLNVEYQLIDGYLICNPTPGPTYSTSTARLTRLENLLPNNHPFYGEVMDRYGDQMWGSYSQDML